MEIDTNLVEDFKQIERDSIEFTKKCSHLVEEIKNKQLTIVQLIEQLGPLLVDKFSDKRELGTWILTNVLNKLPSDHFDENQLNFICSFYADRLKDHHQVIPAVLNGILALTQCDNFPEGAATQILRALFHNVACQQQREGDRYVIYQIFINLLKNQKSELTSMGLDLVFGVISAVDGERNPKNLILLFNWFPTFFKTVQLNHLTEEAFEVISCYFPVDFKAPTQDPNAITRDQLANSLAPCLTAIPQFGQYCFPLALEKFESSLDLAKLDALNLIEIGCSNFTTDLYVQHSTEICSQIQKEIFSNPKPDLEAACLTTLTAVLRKISDDKNFNTTIKNLVDTIKGNLLPDSKLFGPSIKLLLSVAKASRLSARLTAGEIVPILINTFNITQTSQHKATILYYLVDFFLIYLEFHEKIEFPELDKVPILYLKSAFDENKEIKIVAFGGLEKISRFLPPDVRLSIYHNFQNLLLNSCDGVMSAIFKCLEKLSICYPEEIQHHLIYNLNITDEVLLEKYLEALSVIITQAYFTELIIKLLFEYFHKNISFGRTVIKILRMILQESVNDNLEKILLDHNSISVIVDWVLLNESNLDKACLEDIASILTCLVWKQTSEKQKEIMCGELQKLTPFKPNFLFISYGILSHLRQDVDVDYTILEVLQELTQFGDTSTIAAQLLANLLNKAPDEIVNNFITRIGETPNLLLLTWSAKALLTRNHPVAIHLVYKMVELLEQDDNIAEYFRVLLNDNYDCLSSKSYSVRALLYQQKFFTLITNRLCENYKQGQRAFLAAFGYLLEFTPKRILLLQFEKIFKFIILCLDECDKVEILLTILQIIKDLIVEKAQSIEDHIGDLLNRFLKLSNFDKSMKVRILALQCLQECTVCCPVYKLTPHKPEVLRVLRNVIDDKKRIVRREAVEATSLWFILDSEV